MTYQDLLPKKIISRLMAIILAVVIVSGGAITGITSLLNALNSYQKLHDRAHEIVEIAVVTLAYPLWNVDERQVEEVSRALLRDRNLVAINVVEKDRTFMSVVKNEAGGLDVNFTKSYSARSGGDDKYAIRADIFFKDEILGSVEIVYSSLGIANEIFTWTGTLILGTILLVFLITQVIYFSIKRMFIKPILTLANTVQTITRTHDYSMSLAKMGDDEIGDLYDDINEMLTTILRGQNELAKTKSILQGVIDSMPSVLIAVNEGNEILLWNKETEAVTGLKASDIIGRRVDSASGAIDDLGFYLDLFSNTNTPAYFFRRRLNAGDPKLRDISIFPLFGEGVSGAVVRVDDVTDSVSKERQLEQAQKMETIGTLAGGLAHDFNNVLAGVLGSASLIRMEIEADPKSPIEGVMDLVEAIEFSGKRASGIVQQLLTLARRTEPDIKSIDLNEIVANVVKICQNTFDKSIEIGVTPWPGEAMAEGDAAQLEQVVLNLCVNASHAMTFMRKPSEKQGGMLGISLSRVKADPKARQAHPDGPAEYWQVAISDTGIGMDEKTMSKIFDPFFTTKDKGHGTGLGLAIVYSIVKQHGGHVDIESAPGKGAVFKVMIPTSTGEMLREPETSQSIPFVVGKGTILIVDDEPLVRATAKSYLAKCGFAVVEAENGYEGVRAFSEDKDGISLVILDMVMPKMSGREAFYELKRIRKDVKVLVSSGFKKDQRVQELLDSGAAKFLKKPYTIRELSECVASMLGLEIVTK